MAPKILDAKELDSRLFERGAIELGAIGCALPSSTYLWIRRHASKNSLRAALLGAACLVAVVIAVQGYENQSSLPWTTRDSWHYPASNYPGNAHELGRIEVHEVVTSAWPQAEAMLRVKPIVELSPSQSKVLLGGKTLDVVGKKPFLVRAVYLNKETGGFTVMQKNKRLWVEHGSLGHNAVPMKRRALIVFLKSRPNEVFVDCSMDE